MKILEKTYNPQQLEQQWYQHWEQQDYFSPKQTGTPYCIMIPPPNVTGSLHMGHGFQHTIMDVLTRLKRMQGCDTLWQVGTDHAGIATQMVVERQLQAQNISRHELGREKFVEKIWDWKKQSGNTITQQMRRLGNSVDWKKERFTIDDEYSAAVQQVFIQLHKEGLIYRGKRLVNWDPVLQTAISDLEVNSTEENGSLWHLRYPLADNPEDYLIVATTRPETMLGDTAVAVHPDDERYQHLIGKKIKLPITHREIPIIADDYVEQDFGTGCVKITPGHDFNDFEMGKRHNLEVINLLTPTAYMNDNAPKAYQGMDRFVARKQVVKDLERDNLLEKIEPHKLMVPRGDRSNSIVEPYLTDQWYVNTKPLAKPAIDAVKNGEVRFVPENWTKTYFQWLDNIEDWCISRQLWWGHRIPAWYDEQGNCYVGNNEEEIRKQNNLASTINLTQDNDVLDTWFSSALWPFATLGWPAQTSDLERYFPTDVLVTGFDIIFFWVARMMMMSLKFTGKIPFKDVYITGLIRDSEGHKMSKSKGNVLDPLDIIDGIDLEALLEKRTSGMMQPEKAKAISKQTKKEFPQGIASYGTDALRFTYCSLASTGRDIRFDMGRVEGYRNFCNKLWNASRFVLMNCEDFNHQDNLEPSLADQWIQYRLNTAVSTVTKHIEDYRFDLATQVIYSFIWNDYCDWYLEFAKATLYDDNASHEDKQATQQTLLTVLESLLRLTHPFMPYITESIWQNVSPLLAIQGDTIMLQPYPTVQARKEPVEIIIAQQVIGHIRNIRSEAGITPSTKIDLVLKTNEKSIDIKTTLAKVQHYVKALVKVKQITWLDEKEEPPVAASAYLEQLEIHVPLAGIINISEELARLDKQIAKLNKDKDKVGSKLDNANYIAKAPAHLIEKEKLRFNELKSNIDNLNQRIDLLNKIN